MAEVNAVPFVIVLNFKDEEAYSPERTQREGLELHHQILEYLRIEVPSDPGIRVVHVDSHFGSLVHIAYAATDFLTILGDSYSQYQATEWLILRLAAVIDKEYAGKLKSYSVTGGRLTSVDDAPHAAVNLQFGFGVVASRSKEFETKTHESVAQDKGGPLLSHASEERRLPWLSIGLFGIIVLMNVLPFALGGSRGSDRIDERIDDLFLMLSGSGACCLGSQGCHEGDHNDKSGTATVLSNEVSIQVPKPPPECQIKDSSSPSKIIRIP